MGAAAARVTVVAGRESDVFEAFALRPDGVDLLVRPKNGRRRGLPASVTLRLVDIRETDPPRGQPAVHWRLLTTPEVSDVPEAWAVGELYRRRWGIEQLFRTMKTQGFDMGDGGGRGASSSPGAACPIGGVLT